MNIKKYILGTALFCGMGLAFTSCGDDDFTPTIFPDVPDTADPASATYKFDTWLNQNFRDVYNLQFMYRMADVETDYDFDLTPASLANSEAMAVLTKYVWYDAYAEAFGSLDNPNPEFIRQTGPKMIHLIGSNMYNNDGTRILGYATGGVKITLTAINYANFRNIQELNNLYFHTMHHEFAHILHQRKSYPTEFNLLSNGRYDGTNWFNRNGGLCASLGFQTPYAGESYTEDFAETVSNYITRTDADYEMLYWCADQGWYAGEDETDQKVAHSYYYYKNEAAREADDKTYTLRYESDPYNSDLRVYDLEGKAYRTVADINAYLQRLETKLKNDYKDVESKARYNKPYAQLDDDVKSLIDALADARQFVFPVPDTDNVNGREIIEQKINIARNWFREAWGLDLDNLRRIVQRRGAEYDLDALLRQIDEIPMPDQQ